MRGGVSDLRGTAEFAGGQSNRAACAPVVRAARQMLADGGPPVAHLRLEGDNLGTAVCGA